MERRNEPTTVVLPSGWQRRAAKGLRTEEKRGAVLVAERCSEVTRTAVGSELPVSVDVMVRPYSGHPIKRQGKRCTLG